VLDLGDAARTDHSTFMHCIRPAPSEPERFFLSLRLVWFHCESQIRVIFGTR